MSEEEQKAIEAMYAASARFYLAAQQTGVHAFIEFTGLMNEYIKICTKNPGFMHANTHSEKPLRMESYEAEYLAEKLDCIYGPSLRASPQLARALTIPDTATGQLVSRAHYDEALNAIVAGDKRLEAAIARADAAEASLAKKGPSKESLAFATVLNDAVTRADRAEARAIAAEAREREICEKLDKATGMVEMHVGDAEAARLLWRSSEKACAHMDTQRAAAHADRDAAEARAITAEAESSRLRHAALEVLAWSLNDMTALLTNPPQNAALFHTQRLLREAMGD